MIVRWLLALYPRGWRDRYAGEVTALLSSEPVTLRLVLDLVAGAVDARLNPQLVCRRSPAAGEESLTMFSILPHCKPAHIDAADHRRSAVLVLVLTLAFAIGYILLKRLTVNDIIVDAAGISSFPAALIISSWNTYLKPYSVAAKVTIIVGMVAIMFGLSLAAALI